MKSQGNQFWDGKSLALDDLLSELHSFSLPHSPFIYFEANLTPHLPCCFNRLAELSL